MATVGAEEAKRHFAKLLQRVEQGECIIITRRRVPVATLQPVASSHAAKPEEVISQLRALRSRYRLNGLQVRQMKDLGRA